MTAYNRQFDLDLAEMDVIEDALRSQVKALADEKSETASLETERKLRAVKSVLGRLHNQKVFYRPKHGYIGG